MTKAVRIENADLNADNVVVVERWYAAPGSAPHVKLSEEVLTNPTDITTSYATDDTYIVIKEVPRARKFGEMKDQPVFYATGRAPA